MPPSSAEVAPFIPYREHRWKGSLQQLIEVRRQAGVAQDRFCAVHYRDLVSDPLAVVRRIYEYFGLPLSDQTETSMRHFCEHNPQIKTGPISIPWNNLVSAQSLRESDFSFTRIILEHGTNMWRKPQPSLRWKFRESFVTAARVTPTLTVESFSELLGKLKKSP